MITIVNDLRSVLAMDFAQARDALDEARLRQALKDTPTSRTAVAELRAGIDALLDMYLDAGGTAR
jgi:hypothetical protein